MGISIIVPVYNAERTLDELIERLEPVLKACSHNYEAILVNDGSRDGSWEVILRLADLHPWIRGLDLMRNYGQHNALLEGILAARQEVIVTLDDDLQNPPEEIPRLLEKLQEGYDVVYGTPDKKKHSIGRRIGSWIIRRVLRSAVGPDIAQNVSSFRALRAQVRIAFKNYRGPFIIIDAPLAWATSRFGAVTVRHDRREGSKSNYNFRRLLSQSFNALVGFSVQPLKFASLIGFFLTLFGIGVLGYAIVIYLLQGHTLPDMPFLASIIAIFSGAQLLVLGITGEYLSRMYFRTMGRPGSIVRATTNITSGSQSVSGGK